jgi:hypothetical protein
MINGIITNVPEYRTNDRDSFIIFMNSMTLRVRRSYPMFYTFTRLLPTITQINSHLWEINNVPPHIKIIYYNNNLIRRIENLPDGLLHLYIRYNYITKIENIPPSLQILDVSYNDIAVLENLPLSLRRIYYTGCGIKFVDNVSYTDINFSLIGYHAIIRIQKRMKRRYAYKHRYIEVNR